LPETMRGWPTHEYLGGADLAVAAVARHASGTHAILYQYLPGLAWVACSMPLKGRAAIIAGHHA
jgi:hypothetical protein